MNDRSYVRISSLLCTAIWIKKKEFLEVAVIKVGRTYDEEGGFP